MWFRKKKKTLKDIPDDAKDAMRQIAGKQLTDKALNQRNLKNYKKSLQLSLQAYEEFNYFPAATIHSNTLVLNDQPNEAIKWLENALNDANNKNGLGKIEIVTNLIWLYRDYPKNNDKAENYLSLARKLAKDIPPSKDLDAILSGVDVEEAILLNNRGDKKRAEQLATRRLMLFPDCGRAKMVLASIKNAMPNSTQIYGMVLADGTIALDQVTQNIEIKLYRGMEEICVSAAVFAMLLLGVRGQGWEADYLFSKNAKGEETLLSVSSPIQISEEDSIFLANALAELREQDECREFVEFVSEGSFIAEELT